MDGRHSWNCDWGPASARTSVTHRHSVPLNVHDGLESKISLGKKPSKEMLDSLTKHIDAAPMQSCTAGLGKKFSVKRFQGNLERMILSIDTDDCCAETWKLVTDGSGWEKGGKRRGKKEWKRKGRREEGKRWKGEEEKWKRVEGETRNKEG